VFLFLPDEHDANGVVNQCCTRIFCSAQGESSIDAFVTSSGLVALITLTFLEIVLGVDNLIFISTLASKLPSSQQDLARRMGLLAAMAMRILAV
jgi:predicted tellurium resistance membrane protein TerC